MQQAFETAVAQIDQIAAPFAATGRTDAGVDEFAQAARPALRQFGGDARHLLPKPVKSATGTESDIFRRNMDFGCYSAAQEIKKDLPK